MTWFIARRVLLAIPVFLGITLLTFVGVRLAPGDPVRASLDPVIAGGPSGEQYIAEKRAQLGLDQPIPVQYGRWLGGVVQGDLGFSFSSARPVTEVLGERILPTLELMGAALAIAVVVGVGVGVTAAFRQYSVFDHAATTFSLLVISIPQFFLGLIFLYVFSVKLRILPTGGMRTLGEPFNLFDHLKHLVMPATILGLGFAGPFVRYTRASVLETIHAEYLVTGRAKGFSERAVAVRHALPNALLPLIAVAGVQLPYLIAGGVVIETVFRWPGMGQLLLTGFTRLDYPVLSGFVMLLAVFVFVGLILSEILYAALDPRVREK